MPHGDPRPEGAKRPAGQDGLACLRGEWRIHSIPRPADISGTDPMSEKSLISVDLLKPATMLVEKVSDAVGWVAAPNRSLKNCDLDAQ
jgi:hypothetical protein